MVSAFIGHVSLRDALKLSGFTVNLHTRLRQLFNRRYACLTTNSH